MQLSNRVTLEPTAAMALLLGRSIYKNSESINKYLEKIDLQSGMMLAEKLKSVMASGTEAMLNRKFAYHQHILHHIQNQTQQSQVVIMGVGYDPISIYLLGTHGEKISRVLEMDMSSFQSKKEILSEIRPEHFDKIQFIQANLAKQDPGELIKQNGYESDKPTTITMEGMMYYLSESEFINLVSSLRSQNKTHSFCVDYIYPHTEAASHEESVQHQIAQSMVEKTAGMKTTVYSRQKIVNLITDLGGVDIRVQTMSDVELQRTGKNMFFTKTGQGVFEFITFNI